MIDLLPRERGEKFAFSSTLGAAHCMYWRGRTKVAFCLITPEDCRADLEYLLQKIELLKKEYKHPVVILVCSCDVFDKFSSKAPSSFLIFHAQDTEKVVELVAISLDSLVRAAADRRSVVVDVTNTAQVTMFTSTLMALGLGAPLEQNIMQRETSTIAKLFSWSSTKQATGQSVIEKTIAVQPRSSNFKTVFDCATKLKQRMVALSSQVFPRKASSSSTF